MMLNELNLAIVGHTNVGKTSLLRTLTQDSVLGKVSDKPGTTRHVEAIKFSLHQGKKIVFYDTPGLEDSIALFDYISRLNRDNPKQDGIDKLQQFLASPEAKYQFEQEAKVIRQLLNSQAAIYVIDVREPILAKYHDEIAVLTYSDKPILAVLNFTASDSPYEEGWKQLLSRVGVHITVRFDAVFPSLEGEERLYSGLSLLLESANVVLSLWQERINQQRLTRQQTAKLIIAEALVDVAAYSEKAKDDITSIAKIMQNKVRQREHKAINDLLKLYRFNIAYETNENLPLVEGRFSNDLFNLEAIKLVGISVGKGMISGATIGASFDLALGGITLGSAALIGATVGGLAQAIKHYGSKIKNHFAGYTKMSIDDAVICYLSIRLMQLNASLATRAHADKRPIVLEKLNESAWKKGKLSRSLQVSRIHQEWSSLNKKIKIGSYSEQRQEVIDNVANELQSVN